VRTEATEKKRKGFAQKRESKTKKQNRFKGTESQFTPYSQTVIQDQEKKREKSNPMFDCSEKSKERGRKKKKGTNGQGGGKISQQQNKGGKNHQNVTPSSKDLAWGGLSEKSKMGLPNRGGREKKKESQGKRRVE